MIQWVKGETAVIPCTVSTILPHLKVCNALFSQAAVANFPSSLLEETEKGLFAPDLYRQMEDCFHTFALPW